ncbi:IS1634 family transposase [Pontibacter sp. G13]|uniref:IS1634 family transposase n=1 Tax=Pontibacter sp. G13 TaxID=3074898 RepID=UPI00288BC337|nr:IS1634 family transposase [Pontibacter sp. G13]WNJ20689.1 IS1634 family transposase [Pontibacter sp. G13]
MFVRKKTRPSGTVCVQVIDKSSGRSKVVHTVGHSDSPTEIARLVSAGHAWIARHGGQSVLDFNSGDPPDFFETVSESIESLELVGPDLIFGQLFDEVGFSRLEEPLFRELVISRLAYPGSKLKTVDYLSRYRGQLMEVSRLYRYLDKLHAGQMEQLQQISFEHTRELFGGEISLMFYDVTTLYFEASEEDDLRRMGFSKEGKHRHPQILLGLLVSPMGYPLSWELFHGKKYEGETLLPVLGKFVRRFGIENVIVVADSGLLSRSNMELMEDAGYEYILGARLKNESGEIKEKILDLDLAEGQGAWLKRSDGRKLLVTYSEKRASKDAFNRNRGLQKLEKAVKGGKLGKQHINNRGYNKYLKMEGSLSVSIDYGKFERDAKWDGLKGYITNTELDEEKILANYAHLWQIERAFRISKTDLRVRPIYHRVQRRIEAHICISFCAYKIYRELERQLSEKGAGISVEQAILILKSIFAINVGNPETGEVRKIALVKREDQKTLLKTFGIDWRNLRP